MPTYKLTEQDVSNIRELRAAGLTQQCVADKMDVSRTAISEIDRGVTHKTGRGFKLCTSRVEAIKAQLAAGVKQRYLAALYQVSQPTICKIGKGEIWN